MGASTAPTVKATLLTLLRADTALSGVQIDWSDPGQAIGQEELFYGRTIETEEPSPGMGQRRQREKYYLEVYIYVAADGDDPQTIETRCWALVAELENTIRANNMAQGALGTALVPGGWVVMGATEMTPFVSGGQRVAEALCRVNVEAIK